MVELKLLVNENPILSAPRGKLRLVATNGVILENPRSDSAPEMPASEVWPPNNLEKTRGAFSEVENSAWISQIKYDHQKRTLTIVTNKDKIYEYVGVSKIVYERFMNAPSKGRYFWMHIRNRFNLSETA